MTISYHGWAILGLVIAFFWIWASIELTGEFDWQPFWVVAGKYFA